MGGGGDAPEVEETAAERALAETSAMKWKDYQENFVPLENQYMQRVNDLGTENAQGLVGNQARSQVMSQMQGQNSGLAKQSFQQNLDPTSGAFKTKSMALNNAIQKTRENAANNAQFAAENSYIQGLGNIVAMGNGQETTAFNSMGNLAQQATGEAINDARNDFTKLQSDKEMTGAVVGGLASYGMNAAQGGSFSQAPTSGQTSTYNTSGWDVTGNNANNPFNLVK